MTEKEIQVVELARTAVGMKAKWGHSDVGEILVLMLQGSLATEEALYEIECHIQDCTRYENNR